MSLKMRDVSCNLHKNSISMLRQKKLNTFFYSKWDKIEFHFITFCETGDQDHIHKLRLEFKKIRALISFIVSCTKKSSLKEHIKPTLEFYRNAGYVRDAYISLMLHSNFEDDKNKEHLENLQNVSSIFCERRDEFLNLLLRYRISTPINFEDISNKDATRFFNKRLNYLRKEFRRLRKDRLHEDRKLIKKLLYVYPILPKKVKLKINLSKKFYDTVQEMIGNWHDIKIALQTYLDEDSENNAMISNLQTGEEKAYENLVEFVNNDNFIEVK